MRSPLAITPMEQTLATTLLTAGSQELDNAIIGEQLAKEMFMAALAMGDVNVVLIGKPGGGKSTLIENVYRVIDGITEDNVAFVPHRADLTAAEVVGESARSTRSVTNSKGVTTQETITAELEALINHNSQAVIFDELTRANPFALNAALGILAKRKMIVDRKIVRLNKIELVASAINPAEPLTASFKPTPALTSRQTMGAILGANDGAERELIQTAIWHDDWTETPELIEPVITLAELHQIRTAIPKVILSDVLKNAGKQATMNTRDALADEDLSPKTVDEADGRIAANLKRMTRTLTLLRGRVAADPQDLFDAVHYTVTGRLGFRGATKADINTVVDHIYR